MTKIRDILIISAVLFGLAFVFGCKDEAEIDYGFIEWNCFCGKQLGGTYIKPHYWFECATCGTVSTNTECKTVEEYYELVGAGWLND